MSQLQDHPLRYELTNELHTRPFPSMAAPGTVVFLALKQSTEVGRDADADRALLIKLLDRFGAKHPQPEATHYSGALGKHYLKWEQHTEFVTYTLFCDGLSERAFDPVDFDAFPADWMGAIDHLRMTSLIVRVEPRGSDDEIKEKVQEWFVPESVALSAMLDGAVVAGGDFRIDTAGHLRFALFVSKGTGHRRIGRVIQRICEIETYKTMSMLGFAKAKEMASDLNRNGAELTSLISQMPQAGHGAGEALNALLKVTAELESLSANSAYRFAATKAYAAIVNQRVEVLREERFQGRQTFREFMMRRYDPAMRTVTSTEERLNAMTNRATRAGNLLRTRVDVERAAQNQSLLESMDRRAGLQLRLQRTVEGLSVVAISYYAVSLAAYILYPFADIMQMSKGTLTALVTLPILLLVWWAIRRIHKQME